jgi:hypothetical protein
MQMVARGRAIYLREVSPHRAQILSAAHFAPRMRDNKVCTTPARDNIDDNIAVYYP